ncbi:hypothetical protein DEAC_c24270 [Desulfosporosinus acididurans]|uniref:Uncharacterized protein n=1 Tax=Desulfosporosinus acididurans TaxID=476652 RepID=A0A0J1FR71_9FIRM|nr:hypothetical protein DEAC_c24270 [Desulfosporosinus acididurans]
MRKNYFVKLVNYMKNVYQIDRGLDKLSDGRVNPTYSTVLMAHKTVNVFSNPTFWQLAAGRALHFLHSEQPRLGIRWDFKYQIQK